MLLSGELAVSTVINLFLNNHAFLLELDKSTINRAVNHLKI